MADTQTWLVTGGSGQVGSAIVAGSPPNVRMLAPGRDRLDLSQPCDFSGLIADERITFIINCGAYTAVDRAQSEPDLAYRINAAAAAELATAAAQAAIPIIHISTDYVFAGDKTDGAYVEDDPVGPRNVYGASKHAGEQAVAASGAAHAIVRTAWVVSATGQNFVRTMLRLGRERPSLSIVNDQHGSPTSAADLATALIQLAVMMQNNPGRSPGLLHLANAGHVTWHGLAAHVFARAAMHGYAVPRLDTITTADYPTAAARPANSTLDTRRAAEQFGIVMPPWQQAVDAIVDQILTEDGLT